MGYIASSIDRRPRGRSLRGTSIYGYISEETIFFFMQILFMSVF